MSCPKPRPPLLDIGREILHAWTAFLGIPIRYTEIDIPGALRLAEAHGLYAYDAYIIEAARSARAPLLTLDVQQRATAQSIGIEMLDVEI